MVAEAHRVSAPALLPRGLRLGRYQLLQPIASGGMASVYLARAIGDAGFERIVAIKCCHPHLRGDGEFVSMFLDEARLSAKIHHPNVVSVLDVGAGEPLFLVMEYVEGDPLGVLLDAARDARVQVAPAIVLRVLVDALAGLHAAHTLRDVDDRPLEIVHRDVSPQNILVGVDGVSRIADFGIAKAAARSTVTAAGKRKGKIAYMSPEQLRGKSLDARSDVFSAGIVLWESLADRRLFRAPTDAETAWRITSRAAPRLSRFAPHVSDALADVAARALSVAVEERFVSAAAFAEAIENCGMTIASTRAVGALVDELRAGTLQQRREVLRQLAAQPADAPADEFAGDTTTIPAAFLAKPAEQDNEFLDGETFADAGSTVRDVPRFEPSASAPDAFASPREPTAMLPDAGAMAPEAAPVHAPAAAASRRKSSVVLVPLAVVVLVGAGMFTGWSLVRARRAPAPVVTSPAAVAPSSIPRPASSPIDAPVATIATPPASAPEAPVAPSVAEAAPVPPPSTTTSTSRHQRGHHVESPRPRAPHAPHDTVSAPAAFPPPPPHPATTNGYRPEQI